MKLKRISSVVNSFITYKKAFIHNSSTKFKTSNSSTTPTGVLVVGKRVGVHINSAQSFSNLDE